VLRVPFSEPNLGLLEAEYLKDALLSGWIGGKGDYIDEFEHEFAKFIGVRHAITCSSGTMALQLAYHAAGLSSEHRLCIAADSFIAPTNMAYLFTHKIEKYAADKDTWTLKIDDFKDCFVTAVHNYGNPVDMGCAYKKKFILIEDCAESLGSKFKGKMTGSYGLASTFSFHSAKMITTGEGGMVCTNNDELAKRVRHLKNQSMTEPYKHTGMGYNGRMTNLQAAVGLAQLERIDEFIKHKRMVTDFYNTNLDKRYQRQRDQRNSWVVKWANAYRTEKANDVRKQLSDCGIETRPGFIGEDTIVFPCATTLTTSDLDYIVRMANESIA